VSQLPHPVARPSRKQRRGALVRRCTRQLPFFLGPSLPWSERHNTRLLLRLPTSPISNLRFLHHHDADHDDDHDRLSVSFGVVSSILSLRPLRPTFTTRRRSLSRILLISLRAQIPPSADPRLASRSSFCRAFCIDCHQAQASTSSHPRGIHSLFLDALSRSGF
jgi:hypothetical protein